MLDATLFFSNMQIAAKQVGILYVLILVGAVADRLHVFTEKTAKAGTDLLFYIVTPSVIIHSFLKQESSPSSARNLLISIGCGFLLHFVAIGLSRLVFRRGDPEENVVYRYASIYGNVGYMTLPLTSAILGSEGVFYCSGVVMAFNVIAFTHGVFLMDSVHKPDWKKLFLNPGVISVALGLPAYLLRLRLPDLITVPIAHIDAMQTPLAMIYFGTYLAHTELKTVFRRKKIFLTGAFKLLLLPLVMLLLYKLMGLTGTLFTALMISSCAPSANNTVMFSAKYNKDTGLASQTVAVVSFLSVLTIPLIIALAKSLA